METRVCRAPGKKWLPAALEVLGGGGVVAFPTDTVYGLGADPLRVEAVRTLFEAKGRPSERAIPLLLGEAPQIGMVAETVPEAAWTLIACFWPGPLTLVVPAREEIPSIVRAGGDTVAVRMPDHPVALDLIAAFGRPLAVTSANLSDEPSPVGSQEVLRQLGGRIALVVDGGDCPGGQPSTVLSLSTDPPRVLRLGPVSWDDIAMCLSGAEGS
jgi:L-threonylcarbamoyladenylate synthase